MNTVGVNIKECRQRAGLTQKQLGALCGMPDSQVRKYELGINTPTFDTLKRIADALDVHPADLDHGLAIDLGTDVIYVVPGDMNDRIHITVPAGSPADLALSLTRRLTPEQLRQLSNVAFKLNAEGIAAMLERIAELAEIPRYQAK